MTWSNGLSLEIANYIFEGTGVNFSHNELESIYQAQSGNKILRRGTVKQLCQAVINEWFIAVEEIDSCF